RDFHVTGVQTCALPISRFHPARGHSLLDDLVMHLLEQSWDSRHDRRLYFLEVIGDLLERRTIVHEYAVRRKHVKHCPFEYVRERQHGEAPVVREYRQTFRYRDDVRDEIVVREHHALWRAGRPGGVNYR